MSGIRDLDNRPAAGNAGVRRRAGVRREDARASSSCTSATDSCATRAIWRSALRGDGFFALAPDFYFQHPDQDALHRGEAGYDMSDPEALMWLEAALEALAEMPQADARRLAVMGVCQTARHPLVLAASRPIGAALLWYGAAQLREWAVNSKYPRALEEIIAAVGCPVLGMFGEIDHLIAIDDVRRLRDCLERHRKTFRIHVYRDAPHAGSTTPCRAAIGRTGGGGLGRTARIPARGACARLRPLRRAGNVMHAILRSITISAAMFGRSRSTRSRRTT